MSLANALLLALGLGHLVHMIVVLNASQGLGCNVRWIDRVVYLGLSAAGLAGVAMVWGAWGRPIAGWPIATLAYATVCTVTLLVGLPAATIARAIRRQPAGTKLLRSEDVSLLDEATAADLSGSSRRSRLLHLPFNASFVIHSREWSVRLDDLPPSLDGLTILHLTDLHFAPTYSRRFFERVVDLAVAGGPEPDLVLITGDFLDHDDAATWIVPLLSRLRGRLGQFAVLGNHDYRHDVLRLRRELRTAGFKVLEGKWTTLNANGCRLALGGTTYPWGKDLGLREKPDADAAIVMSHSPDQIYRVSRMGANLMLCGHNHGGQVRFPLVGPILMPSIHGRRFDRGFFRVGKTLMFVGQGVGAKDPIRVGCPAEVVRLVLRSSQAVAGAAKSRSGTALASLRD